MVFSSIEFLLCFLPIFILLYWITPDKFKNVTLVVCSLAFYAYGELQYFVLLILSLYGNFFAGLYLGKESKYYRYGADRRADRPGERSRKRVVLALAVAVNVGALLFFKVNHGKLGLPLGISFYTFQMLSYLIDVYRGTIPCEKSLLRMAVYTTMFPKLLSGPITDYGTIEKKLSTREISADTVQEGLKLFTLGLALKVLIADRIGLLWYNVHVTGIESISTPLAWLAALAYSMEIYFDFYGYSLMAIGLGGMIGFELPQNFRNPYMARSVRDFYRRWHMTLGQWFTRYVYIPLGGSRGKTMQTVRNLLVVWVLTSLWHGNTANYLLWGLLLWACIVLERLVGKWKLTEDFTLLPHLYIWFVIPVSWMCFAITDLGQLKVYLGRMFGLVAGINVPAGDWQSALQDYGPLFLAAFFACTPLLEKLYHKWGKNLAGTLFLAILFWFSVQRLIQEGNNPFMYFNY